MDINFANLNILALTADWQIETSIAYLFAIIASLIFASATSLIFQFAFAEREKGIQVNKSFAVLGPAVTAIFLVIQFSLPLSLGLLGALSFVRFRTPIKEPEEIGYILIVISTSLACAVFKFDIAILLLLTLLVVVLLQKKKIFSVLMQRISPSTICEIFISQASGSGQLTTTDFRSIFGKTGELDYELVSTSSNQESLSYHLRLKSRSDDLEAKTAGFIEEINKKPGVINVNVMF